MLEKSGWQWNHECYFYFRVKEKILPPLEKHYGPPRDNEEGIKNFKKKWKKYKLHKEGKRVFVRIPRKYQNSDALVKILLKNSYVKERVKHITQENR